MFTSEQHIAPNAQSNAVRPVFASGTRLVKTSRVKHRVTYKELSILLGIVVAIIIALTWFVSRPELTASLTNRIQLPESLALREAIFKIVVQVLF